MVALKQLQPHTAIWYKDTQGGQHAADILDVKTTLKSWGIIKVHIERHHDRMPLWIDRKQILSVCD